MKSLFLIAAILVCSAYGDGVGNQLLKSLRICPVVDCAFMACLDDMSTQTQTFHFNGMNCPGCLTCTRPRPIDIKRALNPSTVNPYAYVPYDICPEAMCVHVFACPMNAKVRGYFEFNGKKCSGCLHCPKFTD